MSGVIEEIAAERQRQIEKEGWTLAHDDEHVGGVMAMAAACYAAKASFQSRDISNPQLEAAIVPKLWPWTWGWWKPTNPRRNLIKAAALIVAEIERLDRLGV